jgi:hypothetical protein
MVGAAVGVEQELSGAAGRSSAVSDRSHLVYRMVRSPSWPNNT